MKSLGARWSAGFVSGMSHSSFNNIHRSVSFAPAIEFDLFPYSESNRRSLTFYYTNGVPLHRYTAITIYDRMRETYARHAAGARAGVAQPWGSLEVGDTILAVSEILGPLQRVSQ